MTSLCFITQWEQSRFQSILLGLIWKITFLRHLISSPKSHSMSLLLNSNMSHRTAVQSGTFALLELYVPH